MKEERERSLPLSEFILRHLWTRARLTFCNLRKVADEVRRARERAHKEGTALSRAVIVTGDKDLSHAIRGLKSDGVSVLVIGGSRNTADQ